MAQGEYDEGVDAGVRYTAEELEDIWAKQSNHVELASRITRQSCSFSVVEILYISTNINGICFIEDDVSSNLRSANRVLHRPLTLLVKQQLGETGVWCLPQVLNNPGETMRQVGSCQLAHRGP